MPLLCKRLLSTLAALASLALIAIAPASSSATVRHHRAGRAVHTRAACAVNARRARSAVRGCHVGVHKAHRTHQTKTHRASHQAPATTPPAEIAAILATPCQNTELPPEVENLALVRAAVLCLVNQERARNGRDPLVLNTHLEQAAEGHCAELIADNYFAHVSPSGETPLQRIAATGYIPGPSNGYAIGENLAWGTLNLATPQSIVAAWIASPDHLANILESQYTETGIGVTPAVPASLGEGEPGASYAQEFGVILP